MRWTELLTKNLRIVVKNNVSHYFQYNPNKLMIHFKKKTFIVCKTKDDVIRFISEARKRGFSAMFDIENDLKQFDKLGV